MDATLSDTLIRNALLLRNCFTALVLLVFTGKKNTASPALLFNFV